MFDGQPRRRGRGAAFAWPVLMLLASHVVSASAPLTLLPRPDAFVHPDEKKTQQLFLILLQAFLRFSVVLTVLCAPSLSIPFCQVCWSSSVRFLSLLSSSLHRAAVTFSFFYALAITLLQWRDLCTFAVQACQGQRRGLETTSLVFYFKNCREAPYHALLFWIFLHALFNQRGSFDRAAPYLTQASRKSAQKAEPRAGDQPQHGRESQEFKQKKKRGVEFRRLQGVQRCQTCSIARVTCAHTEYKSNEIIFISYFWLLPERIIKPITRRSREKSRFCYQGKLKRPCRLC